MNQATTQLPGLEVTLVAHKDDNQRLLLASFQADETDQSLKRTPLKVAIVIDRSGSMSGEKLDITKSAVAQFIRSMEPEDRVAVVTYDNRVSLVCGLEPPSENLAQRIEKIDSGGSTDLYGGWVMGAKVVGKGGRVILLSDGLANVGRFTDAGSLSVHAGISYDKYGVTTTTIGVGRDYDEGLMAGMARAGGGAHYYAHTAQSITDAFSQERYSAGNVFLERVKARCNGVTEAIGAFWGGESKKRVFAAAGLDGLEFTVRFTNLVTGERHTYPVEVPKVYGYSEEARLESILQTAAQAQEDMLRVRDPRSAGEMKEQMRKIVLELMKHPAADEPRVKSVIDRLKASVDRLARLEMHYEEADAMVHRKMSMQASHNLRERAKAFSSFAEEQAWVGEMMATHTRVTHSGPDLRLDPRAFQLASRELWIHWTALPVFVDDASVTVAMANPRDGFVISAIERETGRRVVVLPFPVDEQSIRNILLA